MVDLRSSVLSVRVRLSIVYSALALAGCGSSSGNNSDAGAGGARVEVGTETSIDHPVGALYDTSLGPESAATVDGPLTTGADSSVLAEVAGPDAGLGTSIDLRTSDSSPGLDGPIGADVPLGINQDTSSADAPVGMLDASALKDAVTGSGGSGGGGTGIDGGGGGESGGAGGATASPLVIDVSTATNPVVPGQRLLYTITVGNISTRAVDGVGVLLRVPTGLQFNNITDAEPNTNCGNCIAGSEAAWTLGTIAAGTTETITVNATVLASVGDGDSISAPVTLSATGVNPTIVTKVVQVHSLPSAQLALGTAYSPMTPTQSFTLDLDVGQIGTAALTGTELRATVPAGLNVGVISDGGTQPTPGQIVWTIGGVPVGAALHRTVQLTVDTTVPAGSILAAHAMLTYDGGVAVDGSADLPISVVGSAPALKVDVGVASNPVVPGGRLLYTATVSNVSTRSVDAVALLLRVPTGLQFNNITDVEPNTTCGNCVAGSEAAWILGAIASGTSRTITVNATVVATAVGDGNLVSAPITVRATGVNDVNVIKTVQVFSHPAAQLALGTITNPVTAGQSFAFDLDVGQIGTTALTGAELHVSLPPGLTVGTISDGGSQAAPGADVVWTVGTLAVGATFHHSVAVTLDGATVPGTILSAHASLTYDGGDPVDALADCAVMTAPAVMPLKMDIVATPIPATPGMRLLYTTTIANTSARAIDGVALLLRVPAGLQFNNITDAEPNTSCGNCVAGSEAAWNIGTLAAGGSQIVTVNALVVATLLSGSLIPASTELTATGLTGPIWVNTTIPTH